MGTYFFIEDQFFERAGMFVHIHMILYVVYCIYLYDILYDTHTHTHEHRFSDHDLQQCVVFGRVLAHLLSHVVASWTTHHNLEAKNMNSWDCKQDKGRLPKRHSSSGGSIPGFEKGEQVCTRLQWTIPLRIHCLM